MPYEKLIPTNFLDALGGVFAALCIIFLFLSLIPSFRSTSIRTFSTSAVISLSLFANSWLSYFIAIVIVAANFLNLNFLETIVAIIRGNKGYFPYKAQMAKVDFSGTEDESFDFVED